MYSRSITDKCLLMKVLPPEYAPQIKIIDSEALGLDMKAKLGRNFIFQIKS